MGAMIGLVITNFLMSAIALRIVFKPPGINLVFGYRTPKSMVNEETWEYANKKAGGDILVVSVINMFIIALLLIFVPSKYFENMALGFFAIIMAELVFIIISTERHLNKKFKDVYSGQSKDSKNGKEKD